MKDIERISNIEKKYINEVLDNFRTSSGSALNTRLEKKSLSFMVQNIQFFINGTATMHAILLAKGIEGDEVIVPPLTMAALLLQFYKSAQLYLC